MLTGKPNANFFLDIISKLYLKWVYSILCVIFPDLLQHHFILTPLIMYHHIVTQISLLKLSRPQEMNNQESSCIITRYLLYFYF